MVKRRSSNHIGLPVTENHRMGYRYSTDLQHFYRELLLSAGTQSRMPNLISLVDAVSRSTFSKLPIIPFAIYGPYNSAQITVLISLTGAA